MGIVLQNVGIAVRKIRCNALKRRNKMKVVTGIMLIALSIFLVVVGVFVFIGGIMQFIDGVKGDLNGLYIALGLFRVVASSVCGILSFTIPFTAGWTLLLSK